VTCTKGDPLKIGDIVELPWSPRGIGTKHAVLTTFTVEARCGKLVFVSSDRTQEVKIGRFPGLARVIGATDDEENIDAVPFAHGRKELSLRHEYKRQAGKS
jgi:hypothetical protein